MTPPSITSTFVTKILRASLLINVPFYKTMPSIFLHNSPFLNNKLIKVKRRKKTLKVELVVKIVKIKNLILQIAAPKGNRQKFKLQILVSIKMSNLIRICSSSKTHWVCRFTIYYNHCIITHKSVRK